VSARRRIQAVLFDFDHTLGNDNRLEERVMRLLADRYCSVKPSDEDIVQALRQFRHRGVGLEEMLADAFARCGHAGDVTAEYKAEALRLLPGCLVPMPGAETALRSLEDRGLKLALLTNGWTELQDAKAALIGFKGPVIVSEQIGAWKPDAKAFDAACACVSAAPASAAYVGDSPLVDVAGAKHAGLTAIWANLEDHSYPSDMPPPDYTITSLGALPALIASIG